MSWAIELCFCTLVGACLESDTSCTSVVGCAPLPGCSIVPAACRRCRLIFASCVFRWCMDSVNVSKSVGVEVFVCAAVMGGTPVVMVSPGLA